MRPNPQKPKNDELAKRKRVAQTRRAIGYMAISAILFFLVVLFMVAVLPVMFYSTYQIAVFPADSNTLHIIHLKYSGAVEISVHGTGVLQDGTTVDAFYMIQPTQFGNDTIQPHNGLILVNDKALSQVFGNYHNGQYLVPPYQTAHRYETTFSVLVTNPDEPRLRIQLTQPLAEGELRVIIRQRMFGDLPCVCLPSSSYSVSQTTSGF